VKRFQSAGIKVSMFIEPDAEQIEASAAMGADAIELHTGAFANALEDFKVDQVDRLQASARLADQLKLVVNGGHGINYGNVKMLLKIPQWNEFNIGHSVVSRALFVGLEQAVRDMLDKIVRAK
jgi:pyridoxine 5-phosphate synthase